MPKRHKMILETIKIRENISQRDLYNLIASNCDDDFNGRNGRDYWTMSKESCDLNYYWRMIDANRLYREGKRAEIAIRILEHNYAFNDYYVFFDYDHIKTNRKECMDCVVYTTAWVA